MTYGDNGALLDHAARNPICSIRFPVGTYQQHSQGVLRCGYVDQPHAPELAPVIEWWQKAVDERTQATARKVPKAIRLDHRTRPANLDKIPEEVEKLLH